MSTVFEWNEQLHMEGMITSSGPEKGFCDLQDA